MIHLFVQDMVIVYNLILVNVIHFGLDQNVRFQYVSAKEKMMWMFVVGMEIVLDQISVNV